MKNGKTRTELPVGFLFSNSKRTIEIENQGLAGGRGELSFEVVMKYIINNFEATTSVQNITEDIIKRGIPIKRETVNRYEI